MGAATHTASVGVPEQSWPTSSRACTFASVTVLTALTRAASPSATGGAAGNNFAVIPSDDAGELSGYWAKLSAGGKVAVPLEKQMWGDTSGMCTDRFGVEWMVNIAGAPTA